MVTNGETFDPINWLQFLQYALKCNGLLSFNISKRPPHATASRLWNCYSFLFTLYISFQFCFSISCYLYDYMLTAVDSTQTQFLVYVILLMLSAEKSNFIYILQYLNRNKLSTLVNEGYELHHHICIMCKDVGVPANYNTMLKAKIFSIFLQVAILISASFAFDSFDYNALVLLYSHWTVAMMSSTIFSGLFVVWQFYLALNNKLRQCMAKVKAVTASNKIQQMRMQRFCDLSDEIDRLACLYARCSVLTEQMNKYFSVTLFVTIAYTFGIILSQLFFIYSVIAKLVTGISSDTAEMYRCGVIILYYSMDIYFIVSVSGHVANAGRQPGMMLYSMEDDIDARLNRSVSHFN